MQYQMDESNECELYVKERTSEEPWTCELCHISEIKIQLLVTYIINGSSMSCGVITWCIRAVIANGAFNRTLWGARRVVPYQ